MVNEGYNAAAGTVHGDWEDPFQLAYPEPSLGHLPYPDHTVDYHNREHLQSIPEENRSFYNRPIGLQVPSYHDMAPEIATGQHIRRRQTKSSSERAPKLRINGIWMAIRNPIYVPTSSAPATSGASRAETTTTITSRRTAIRRRNIAVIQHPAILICSGFWEEVLA
ncbi:hypothetical protein BDD12DRAFT_810726 [Trichophaea hybrida]|nr:hypothetical protein BDD12DRAFT_810726 [Trichophaea hybrida]